MKKPQCGTEVSGVYPAPAFPRKSIPCAVRGGQGYGTGSAKREARLSVVGGNLSVYGAILSDLSVWHTFGSVLSVLLGTWKTKIQTI